MKPIYLLAIPAALVLYAAVSGVLLFRQVAAWRDYWQHRNAEQSSAQALVYVALGDSAAQGIGAARPDQGYVGEFARRLSQQHGRPVRVINLSKSGARVQDVLRDQLPELSRYHADVVTLDIGGNDIASFDAATFRSQWRELLQGLPAGTFVADVPYFGGRSQLPLFGSGRLEQLVQFANEIIRELSADAPVVLVPLHDATKQRNGRAPWNYAIDYFHPSTQGYRAWTDVFWEAYQKHS